jgi:hypothetical protein
MSTAHEIENAIRLLSSSERTKLLHDLPNLFPELGDAKWEGIIRDERHRPALTQMLNEAEGEFGKNPKGFPEMTSKDFGQRE